MEALGVTNIGLLVQTSTSEGRAKPTMEEKEKNMKESGMQL